MVLDHAFGNDSARSTLGVAKAIDESCFLKERPGASSGTDVFNIRSKVRNLSRIVEELSEYIKSKFVGRAEFIRKIAMELHGAG
ncbi:hypothetical protein MesoLj113a_31980 [Mesorhizobium sp. 113-1-2]|nr:hypothetical protein MesoLj113a_31980 [Mesorhizobium sp. 113-1-2]